MHIPVAAKMLHLFIVTSTCIAMANPERSHAQTSSVPIGTPQLQQYGFAMTGGTIFRTVELDGVITFDVAPEPVNRKIHISVHSDGGMEVHEEGSNGSTSDRWSAPGPKQECYHSDSGEKEVRLHDRSCVTSATWLLPTIALANSQAPKTLNALYNATEGTEIPPSITLCLGRQCVNEFAPTHFPLADRNVALSLWSARTIFLDPITQLPTAMSYIAYQSERYPVTSSVGFTYTGYKVFQGIKVPTHVTKTVDGHLVEDINIASASVAQN